MAGPMRTALVFLLCAGSALAADKLVGGPYVVFPAARTATIGWVVETGGAEVSGGTGPARRVPVLRSERITLTGLKAGETMQYQIPELPGTTADERKGSSKVPAAG